MFSLKVTSLLEAILWFFVRICLALFVFGSLQLVLSFFPPSDVYADTFGTPAARATLLLTFAWLLTSLVLLYKLVAIVETIRKGDPFISENVIRLRWIAWAVFVGEGLRWVMQWLGSRDATGDGSWDFETDFMPLPLGLGNHLTSPAWSLVVVLLLFALARVFEEGVRLRSEIEEMI